MDDNINVIISFGAAGGGFELTWDIKNRIEKEIGYKAYLDAISLEGDEHTNYVWNDDLGIWKMSNSNWQEHYVQAMGKSKCMVFLITEEWLNSRYCWQEWLLFLNTTNITPIFLMTEEVLEIMREGKEFSLQVSSEDATIWHLDFFEFAKKQLCIPVNNEYNHNDYVWTIEAGIEYHYSNKYSMSNEKTLTLLEAIRNVIEL